MNIFPTGYTGSQLVTDAFGVIQDNIAVVLVVLGSMVGLHIVARALNGARKGKVRL